MVGPSGPVYGFVVISGVHFHRRSVECLERWFEFCEGNDVSTSVCACVLYNDPSPGIFVDFGRDLMTCRQLNNDTACCNKTKDMLLAIYQLDTPVEAQCTEATVLNIGDGDGIDLSAPGTKTYPSSGVRQYIVPSFEFGCDGCVVGLRLWADQEDMLAQELNIHLWKKRTNLSANGNSTLYEERQVFTVSFDTDQDQDEITVPVSRGMNICFKTGEIFGFSQPAGSGYDIYFDIVSSTANTAYRIQRQVPACDNLQGFFELSDEAEVGVPLIELSIGEPVCVCSCIAQYIVQLSLCLFEYGCVLYPVLQLGTLRSS